MRLKKIIIALSACAALAAVAASSAQAVVWKTGTTTLSEENVAISSTGGFSLTGTWLSRHIKVTATILECAGTCKIEGAGHSSGPLRFTGVTADEPANCTVRGRGDAAGSETVTTEALTDQLKMDGETVTFDEFFPQRSGSPFVTLVFEGPTCVLDEDEVPVKGTVTGRTENTGWQRTIQPITFNEVEQKTGGGKLTLGATNEAFLTGVADNELSGAHAGQAFGAE